MEKRHMEQDYSERSDERGDGILVERTVTAWSKLKDGRGCSKDVVRI